VRTSEWVVFAYAAYLLVTAVIVRTPVCRLRPAALLQLSSIALIALTSWFEPARAAGILRDWFPGYYLLSAYWASGLLYRGPNEALEARLEAIDRRAFAWLGPAVLQAPRPLLEFFEFAYLFCYPLPPAALVVLYVSGHRGRADALWVLVLVSALAVYGVLPWVGTRPPRALGLDGWIDRRPLIARRFNLAVLERGSIHVNTFPSGHAASATAVALFMTSIPGSGWPVFAALAAAIGFGAAVGRYHYWADIVVGVLVAVAVFALVG
jgi:membrane-associated phospholipid phosphatase